MTRSICSAGKYTREGEWAGYTVQGSKKGWIVEGWSAISGERTGRRVLVPYDSEVPRETNLCEPWNEHIDTGQYIALLTSLSPGRCRILRRGHKVF